MKLGKECSGNPEARINVVQTKRLSNDASLYMRSMARISILTAIHSKFRTHSLKRRLFMLISRILCQSNS